MNPDDANQNPTSPVDPMGGAVPSQPAAEPQQPTQQAACVKCGGSAQGGVCAPCGQNEQGCTCMPAGGAPPSGDMEQPAPAM